MTGISELRSRNMSAIKSKNTKPEIAVRKLLHSMGYRFRLHRKDLPGSPDIVLPKYKIVIFVHGNLTDTKLSRECPRRDLNPRPLPYQGSALPLSYKGNFKWAGLDLNQRRQSQRIYSPPPLTTRAPTPTI